MYVWKRIRVVSVAAALGLAPLVVGVSASADTGAGPAATAVLTAPPQFDGMTGWPGDGNGDPASVSTTAGGRACWTTSSTDLFQYFRIDDDRIPASARYASVTVDYYDAGPGRFTVQYSGQSAPFVSAPSVQLTGGNTWRTTTFDLSAIKFTHQSNGADFRIASWDASFGFSQTPVCISRVAVSFSTAPPLVVSSSSLVFAEGQANISVDTAAAAVDWTVTTQDGVNVTSGTAAVSDGKTTIDVHGLSPGYYTLRLSADIAGERRSVATSFGVVTPLPAAAISPNSPFGVGTHYGQRRDTATMDVARQLGIANIRDEVSWPDVETQKGSYTYPAYAQTFMDKAHSLGLTPLLIADYSNPLYDDGKTPTSSEGQAAFGRYADALVGHFGLNAVEVYNEFNGGFNNGSCGPTPDCYLPLLKATNEAVKSDHPQAKVVGPATAGLPLDWIHRLLDLGGLNYLDVVTIHPYRQPSPPESLGADLQSLREDIRNHNNGNDKPIWITEMGWPTNEGSGTSEQQEADYVIRAQTTALANGVSKFFWYDLENDGTDPTNSEHNFGLIRQPTADVIASAPKPAAIAEAALTRQLAGLSYKGTDNTAAPAYSYRFGSGSQVTRVMWSTTPQTALLHASQPLTVTDQYGKATRLIPVGGTVQVDLTGAPVFVRGDVDQIAMESHPTYQIAAPAHVAAGDPVPVTLTVDRSHGAVTPGKVTFSIDGGSYSLTTTPDAITHRTVQLPSSNVEGTRAIEGTIYAGPQAIGRVVASTEVEAPTAISLDPRVSSVSPLAGQLAVNIANNRASGSLMVSGLDWSVGDQQGHVDSIPAVPAGQTATVTVDVPDVTPWVPYAARVNATLADGTVVTTAGTAGFDPIEPLGKTEVLPIDLANQAVWQGLNGQAWGGASNLSGTVRLNYTDQDLILTADLTDDTLGEATSPADLYNGDSIQLAVSPAPPGQSTVDSEIGVGPLASGPAVYRWIAAPGQPTGVVNDASAIVTRSGTTTHYQLTVPWTDLGFSGQPTGTFAVSLLANDNDGSGRRGWLEWGSGIGGAKATSLFRPAQLTTE